MYLHSGVQRVSTNMSHRLTITKKMLFFLPFNYNYRNKTKKTMYSVVCGQESTLTYSHDLNKASTNKTKIKRLHRPGASFNFKPLLHPEAKIISSVLSLRSSDEALSERAYKKSQFYRNVSFIKTKRGKTNRFSSELVPRIFLKGELEERPGSSPAVVFLQVESPRAPQTHVYFS